MMPRDVLKVCWMISAINPQGQIAWIKGQPQMGIECQSSVMRENRQKRLISSHIEQ